MFDKIDPPLELQGVPWIIRKAVVWAAITGKLSQTKDDTSTTNITVEQTSTGGIKGESEVYKLDGSKFAGSGMFGIQSVRCN